MITSDAVDWPALILGDDPLELADALGDTVGPIANAEGLYFCCRDRLTAHGMADDWSEGTWRSWLKNRAVEADSLRTGGLSDREDRIVVPLHIGFIAIEETGEHLEALRRGDGSTFSSPTPARSGIGSTNQMIHPINRVAFRVVPDREGAVA